MSYTIRKVLPDGSIKIQYNGTLREKTEDHISIDTGWSREPLDLGYVLFEPDDKWIETFFFERWYNIFRIADSEASLKGFYINISKPPIIRDQVIDWEDLAIDVWVRPDGTYIVLDEDEFEELDIDKETRKMALKALETVKKLIGKGDIPLLELS
jgi:hypothetical protein